MQEACQESQCRERKNANTLYCIQLRNSAKSLQLLRTQPGIANCNYQPLFIIAICNLCMRSVCVGLLTDQFDAYLSSCLGFDVIRLELSKQRAFIDTQFFGCSCLITFVSAQCLDNKKLLHLLKRCYLTRLYFVYT